MHTQTLTPLSCLPTCFRLEGHLSAVVVGGEGAEGVDQGTSSVSKEDPEECHSSSHN